MINIPDLGEKQRLKCPRGHWYKVPIHEHWLFYSCNRCERIYSHSEWHDKDGNNARAYMDEHDSQNPEKVEWRNRNSVRLTFDSQTLGIKND